MKEHSGCPNCGRSLTESEIYCYFCELEIEKSGKEKPENKKRAKNN
ncbi:hypothetical protein HYY71_03140 [Candidatus Woesearchaeota archaeon]|nr:hypothetical protein [Candidatus Woesearchaeota archaeon]